MAREGQSNHKGRKGARGRKGGREGGARGADGWRREEGHEERPAVADQGNRWLGVKNY